MIPLKRSDSEHFTAQSQGMGKWWHVTLDDFG